MNKMIKNNWKIIDTKSFVTQLAHLSDFKFYQNI